MTWAAATFISWLLFSRMVLDRTSNRSGRWSRKLPRIRGKTSPDSVANFVQSQGGTVHVESAGENQGTKVVIRFPENSTKIDD
ncbi:MAG: hypothetical protein HQL68_09410 [Magnetococcales bacterium]|nr:hypothetical protein [Magnetococcales bacterium]